MGQAIQLENVAKVAEDITESVLRNSGALVGLSAIKDKDEYKPVIVDLARPMGQGGADKIMGHEDPVKWGINVAQFLFAAA